MDLQPGFQRPEAQRAFLGGIDQLVKAQSVPHAGGHHEGGVEHQIVGGYDVQFLEVLTQPAGKFIAEQRLPGGDDGKVPDVPWTDHGLGGQRTGLGHEKPPGVGGGKADVVVLLHVGRLDENAKIQQPFIQALRHVVRVSAE